MNQQDKLEMIENRRYIHQNPEIGFEVFNTLSFVVEKLKSYGLKPQIIADTGVIVDIGEGDEAILFRCDMDALPMKEESGLPFASTNEFAHTCGHDLHTAMLLAVAKQLSQKKLKTKIRLLFQPAEECIMGAKLMIENNVLQNVKCAYGLHMVTQNWDKHQLVYRKGHCTNGSYIFSVKIKGKGGHASMPHLVIDPLKIGIQVYNQFHFVLQNELPATSSNVLAIGKFNCGTNHNVIANEMEFEGSIRFLEEEQGEYLFNRMQDVCQHLSKLHKCDIVLEKISYTPAVYNDEKALSLMESAIEGKISTYILENPFPFSEDFSYYSKKVPSVFFGLSCGTSEQGYPYPLHHPKIIFNEEVMETGVKTFLAIVDKVEELGCE